MDQRMASDLWIVYFSQEDRPMTSKRCMWCAALLAAAMLFLDGCGKNDAPQKGGAKAKSGAKKEHVHADEGPHDGALASWGDDEFHAEFTVDHDKKQATIYILDDTATKAPKVAADKITEVKLAITSIKPPVTLDLKHDASKSDAKGIAFVGTHNALAIEMEFKGKISGKIDGKAFSGDFEETPHGHTHTKGKK
jgi:hypothetical protein